MLGRSSRGLTACAALGIAFFAARRLRAQEQGPILLSYRAPAGCPEVAEFQRSVQRRSSHIHFVDEGTHARELSIALSRDGDFITGELRLIESDAGLRQRSVRFTTCAEAVEGLALITAVSLDPQAALQPASPAEPPAKSAAPPSKAAATPATPAPERPPPPPLPRQPAPGSRGAQLGIGAEFSAAFGALPATAPGATLFADVASGSRSWFAPLLRAAVGHWERRGLTEPEGMANFALTLASLAACPVRAGGGSLALRPCLVANVGALRAWGRDTHAHTRPSWSWGGAALLSFTAAQQLDIVADVGLGVAVIRERFAIAQSPFWTTPPLYLSTNIGLCFVFR